MEPELRLAPQGLALFRAATAVADPLGLCGGRFAEGAEGKAGEDLAVSNILELPDVMLGEILLRSPGDDLLAITSTCKELRRIQSLDTARVVSFPSNTHVVTSVALLEWAIEKGWAWPTKKAWERLSFDCQCTLAVGGGCIAVLQRARADGCEWDQTTTARAAEGGHLELLQWLRANGCPWNEKTCKEAAGGGHLECLEWARTNGCPWNEETCTYAAEGGHLECLKWARTNGCPWDTETCVGAAMNGHLECLKWARTNGCLWDEETCAYAAEGGHLECLKWARANDCPWDERTCAFAAGSGQLECLKWARANDCPWGESTCGWAVQEGQLECLKWTFANGIRKACRSAFLSIFLETLNTAESCGWDHIAEWWRANGCPEPRDSDGEDAE